MTLTSGSSGGGGGGSSSSDDKKDRIGTQSKGTRGYTETSGPGAHLGSDSDYTKSSLTGGTGELKIEPNDTSIVDGISSTPPDAHLGGEGGGGSKPQTDGLVDTSVTQKPSKSDPIPLPDGEEDTTITTGPRSDFSVVLAGQTGRRPDRSAARSNNFISLVGGAGGLGRRTSDSKRSLIGGA